MTTEDLVYWVALQGVNEVGKVTYMRLLHRFGNPKRVLYEVSHAELLTIPRVNLPLSESIQQAKENIDEVKTLIDSLLEQGIKIITINDDDYPETLRGLSTAMPPILYLYGQNDLLKTQQGVAIVGTRQPSEIGFNTAKKFATELSTLGYTIISGGAKGIDTAAHLGAINGKGKTIVVLPYGLKYLDDGFKEIGKDNLIISEFYPTQDWSVANAMTRNALIVGLSMMVIIIESGTTGGTMNTFTLAQKQGKKVFCLKYQSPPESALGNEVIIDNGAIPISTIEDIYYTNQRNKG